jgi:hypothetical protein
MRYGLMITALLAAAALPGFAQRGMVSGGGIAGGARPAAVVAPRGLVAGGAGTHQGIGFVPHSSGHPFFAPGVHPGFGVNCARNPFLCRPGFRSRLGYGYSWYGYGGYPIYGWDSGDYTGNDAAVAQLQAELADQQNLNAQLAEELRRQQADRIAAESSALPRPAARPVAERPIPATILVFRDGRRQEVRNYAIAGNTLLDLETNHTRKIQLSELDIPASIRANDERGVEFSVPQARR